MTSLLDRTGRSDGGHGPRRVVVIGGGIAGLATAALLAARRATASTCSRRTTSSAAASAASSATASASTPARRGTSCPRSSSTSSPCSARPPTAELDLTVLDPSYRVFFEGHPDPVDVRPDRAHNRALFESLEPGAGARFDAYLALGRGHVRRRAAPLPLQQLRLRRRRFLRPDVVRRTPALSRLLTRSLGSHVAAHFTDNRLRQVLGYPAVFLGSSPSRAPSIYHLMSRLDLGDRVLYPQGGFTRLIEVIAALAERHGRAAAHRADGHRGSSPRRRRGRPSAA